MTEGQTSNLIYALLVLMLVASSLFARRLPAGQTVRMILAWVGIFSLFFVLFSFREEAGRGWQRVRAEFSGQEVSQDGKQVLLLMQEDGHFWVNANINGNRLRMLVDSGATVTAMSNRDAQRTGIDISTSNAAVTVETANGLTEAKRSQIERFKLGGITRENMPVLVSPAFGETSVLGMDFLSSLRSWRVEGRQMLLFP